MQVTLRFLSFIPASSRHPDVLCDRYNYLISQPSEKYYALVKLSEGKKFMSVTLCSINVASEIALNKGFLLSVTRGEVKLNKIHNV